MNELLNEWWWLIFIVAMMLGPLRKTPNGPHQHHWREAHDVALWRKGVLHHVRWLRRDPKSDGRDHDA